MTIIDGAAQFGCSLEALPDHPLSPAGMTMRRLLAMRKLDVPPLSKVADADPLPAWIQQNMLVASCPECKGKPEEEFGLIWREGPYLFLCHVCGNAAAGSAWRTVALPDDLDAIERVLAPRPMAARSWTPDQTVDDLKTENRRFGWTRDDDEVP